MDQGKRSDLVGGGLVRSAGSWREVQALRNEGIYQKSDERIPGDSDFVENVLAESKERLHKKYAPAAKGLGLEELLHRVAELTSIPVQAMIGPGKERRSVRSRGILCFWAVKELGVALTDLAGRLGISVSDVGAAVQRGGQIVDREKLDISAFLNL